VQQAASQQLVTESIWVKRLVMRALNELSESISDGIYTTKLAESGARKARLYVRLRHEDRILLHERAAARGMAPATFASVLVRSHLRNAPPLPKEELLALKLAVAELGAIGRNLNQLTRAANRGEKVGGPSREDLRAVLEVAAGLRDNVKGLLKANQISWHQGCAE
jgi:hypothetical protein